MTYVMKDLEYLNIYSLRRNRFLIRVYLANELTQQNIRWLQERYWMKIAAAFPEVDSEIYAERKLYCHEVGRSI